MQIFEVRGKGQENFFWRPLVIYRTYAVPLCMAPKIIIFKILPLYIAGLFPDRAIAKKIKALFFFYKIKKIALNFYFKYMMINDILERLKKVKDFRQNQGKRHKILVILSIIVLSILTGNSSYKQIEMFSNNNQDN